MNLASGPEKSRTPFAAVCHEDRAIFYHLQRRRNVLKKYGSYLPTVILLLTTLANLATPAIAAFWASHATVAAIVAPLAVIVAHWLPSPAGSYSN
jgi:hypothetical protein